MLIVFLCEDVAVRLFLLASIIAWIGINADIRLYAVQPKNTYLYGSILIFNVIIFPLPIIARLCMMFEQMSFGKPVLLDGLSISEIYEEPDTAITEDKTSTDLYARYHEQLSGNAIDALHSMAENNQLYSSVDKQRAIQEALDEYDD